MFGPKKLDLTTWLWNRGGGAFNRGLGLFISRPLPDPEYLPCSFSMLLQYNCVIVTKTSHECCSKSTILPFKKIPSLKRSDRKGKSGLISGQNNYLNSNCFLSEHDLFILFKEIPFSTIQIKLKSYIPPINLNWPFNDAISGLVFRVYGASWFFPINKTSKII